MSASPADLSVLRFGAFELDLRSRELRKAGGLLSLPPQPFKILVLLATHPGQLVTREEIQRQIWGSETFVDFEQGLNFAVNKIRTTLGDDADTPRYIETLPRRGYRFVAPVEEIGTRPGLPGREPVDAGAAPQPSVRGGSQEVPVQAQLDLTERTMGDAALKEAVQERLSVGMPRRGSRLLRLAGMLVMLIGGSLVLWLVWHSAWLQTGRASRVQIRSLAVLPLENLSGDSSQEFFSDGMTDELITDLASITSLRVVSRTSTTHYKGTRKTIPEIARELKVDVVVEGSVGKSANKVRIRAQLVRAEPEEHLWAESYERDLNDILGLQREVARAIAQQISATLKPPERARLTGAQPVDPRAYEAYLKGRYFSNKWTEEGVRKGISYFQEAIAIDPTYARAYAGLADSYNALGDFGAGVMAPREASCKAEASALKATELDGMLGEAHAALAMAQFLCDQDWMSADKEFARALELNPSYAAAHHWYAHYLRAAGRIKEALVESKRAYDLSPIDPELGVHLQWHYYHTHDYDSAIQQGLKTMELDPTFHEPHLLLGMAYEQKGMYEDAIRELEKAVELSGRRVIVVSALGHAYALAGKTGAASKLLKELEDLSKHRYISAYDIAIVDVGLGHRDQALTRLEEAYREGSYWVFTLKSDPRLDSLHSNPRFLQLVRRVGLP